MSTRADLRGRLRVILGDEGAAKVWADETLNRMLNDAVSEYSRLFPRELSVEVPTVAGTDAYNLPAGCLAVADVYVVEDEVHLMADGDVYGVGYRVWAGQVVLMPSPTVGGKTVRIRYLGSHTDLAAEGTVSSVPAADESLLVGLAASLAYEGLSGEPAKRYEGEHYQPPAAAAAAWRRFWEAGVRERRRRVGVRTLMTRWRPEMYGRTEREAGG